MQRIQKRAHPRTFRGYSLHDLTALVFADDVPGSVELKVRTLAACLSPAQRRILANDLRRARNR